MSCDVSRSQLLYTTPIAPGVNASAGREWRLSLSPAAAILLLDSPDSRFRWKRLGRTVAPWRLHEQDRDRVRRGIHARGHPCCRIRCGVEPIRGRRRGRGRLRGGSLRRIPVTGHADGTMRRIPAASRGGNASNFFGLDGDQADPGLGVMRRAPAGLLNRRAGISVLGGDSAVKGLRPTPEGWLGMQMAYDLRQAQGCAGEIAVERCGALR